MSICIHKSHNISFLLCHVVCPAKYRKVIFSDEVDQAIKDICLRIADRYEIHFIEIGTDIDHVHFLIQLVPTSSPTKIVRIIKRSLGIIYPLIVNIENDLSKLYYKEVGKLIETLEYNKTSSLDCSSVEDNRIQDKINNNDNL